MNYQRFTTHSRHAAPHPQSSGVSRLVTHERANIYISLSPGGGSGITQPVKWLPALDSIRAAMRPDASCQQRGLGSRSGARYYFPCCVAGHMGGGKYSEKKSGFSHDPFLGAGKEMWKW